jgi:hypothetical protein
MHSGGGPQKVPWLKISKVHQRQNHCPIRGWEGEGAIAGGKAQRFRKDYAAGTVTQQTVYELVFESHPWRTDKASGAAE